MREKDYRLQVIGYSKKIFNILLALLITTTYNLQPTTSIYAQTASSSATPRQPQTSTTQSKKNVVKNFKINLSEYSSFGTNCDKKPQGDANCDGVINDFDLSIWEVEFNSANPPKRADFNGDGAVTILDYGIWRTTSFPQTKSVSAIILNNTLALWEVIQDPEKTTWIPDQVRNDIIYISKKSAELITKYSSLVTVNAQESGGGEVNSPLNCPQITTHACRTSRGNCTTASDGSGLCTGVYYPPECKDFASTCDVPTGWAVKDPLPACPQITTRACLPNTRGCDSADPNSICNQPYSKCQDFPSACDVPPDWVVYGDLKTRVLACQNKGWIWDFPKNKCLAATPTATSAPTPAAPIQASNTFTSGSGNSMVINNLPGGKTQQVNFDQTGNPQTASFYSANGNSYAEVAFTNSGGTVISTQSDGIPVTINKTASGPIIENFKNPDGSPLAIKSWPTQASYDAGQPPVAVTIPGIGSTKEVLNLQPNGDAIVEKLDAARNVLTRTQLRSNGTTVTEDFQNSTLVQSNTEIGFTNMSMKNLIGGETQYMFYKGTLYAIVQTDDKKNTFISKPLDDQGNSWSFETQVDGVKKSEETVPDPITKTGGGTPNPKTLIQYINYYKQSAPSATQVNFSDGFTSTAPAIKTPVDKANAILTISQTQAPNVLGLSIIKEVRAQQSATLSNGQNVSTPPSGSVPSGWGSPTSVDVKSAENPGAAQGKDYTTQSASYTYNANGATLSISVTYATGADHNFSVTPTAQVNGWSTNTAGVPTGSSQTLGVPNPPPSSPGGTIPINPIAPAQPQAPVVAPAQPAPPTGTKTESQQALEAAAKAAAENGGSPAAQGRAAYDAAAKAAQEFGMPAEKATNLANDAFSHSYLAAALREAGVDEKDIQGKTGTELASIAQNRGIESVREINTARSAQGLSAISSPFSAQSTAPTQPAAAAPAAAAVAPGLASGGPQSGFISPGVFSAVVADRGPNGQANGSYTSTITGGPNGTATQHHNPTTGQSTWSDNRGSYTSSFGSLASIHSADTYVGISATTGSLVSTTNPANIDANGFVKEGPGVSQATRAQREEFVSHQREQGSSTGAQQYTLNYTCFLPGTLISTPTGQVAIESLKAGDKVFSYNQQTGQKEISNFRNVSINSVDEYLIINNQIKTTIYHPFYIVYKGKLKTVRADDLKIGDILQNEAGKQIPVYSINRVLAPKTQVFNLVNVYPNNNFYAENILVHNYSLVDTAGEPGTDPYNADGTYTDAWAATGGWNPDMFSASDISPGELGGTTGGSDVSSGLGKGEGSSGGDGWGSSSTGQAETQQDTTQSTQQDAQQDSGSQQSDANSSGADSSGW